MNNDTLQSAEQINKANKQTLTQFMRDNGISHITLQFDGCGDSGQIEEVAAYPEDKQDLIHSEIATIRHHHKYSNDKWELVTETIQADVSSLAEDVAYYVLEQRHGGWEINEGSYGKIVINADGSGSIEYNERVVTTEYSECEF